MKRIKSKSREKKIQKRNQRIIGIILIFVMFGSVFGIVATSFVGQEGNVSVDYNGFEFINENDLWNVVVGNSVFTFRYSPNQVEEINSEVNYLNKYYNEPLYIYSESSLAASEISTNLGKFSQSLESACPEGKECSEGIEDKTCEDNFIIIEEKSEAKIVQENNCVFIQGPQEDLVKITDEFLFKVFGIRQ